MPRVMHKRAAVLYVLVGVISVGATLAAAFRWNYGTSVVHLQRRPDGIPASDLRVLMAKLDLRADVIAAAGVDAGQATAMVERLRDHYAEVAPALDSATSTQRSATLEVERLRGKIVAGRGSATDVASLRAAQERLATAARTLVTLREAVLNDLSVVIGTPQAQKIATIQGNRSRAGLPVHFRTVNRSEADWVTLRNAVASLGVSARRGEPVSPAALAVVSAAESESAVASAKAGVQENTAAVEAALSAAVSKQ